MSALPCAWQSPVSTAWTRTQRNRQLEPSPQRWPFLAPAATRETAVLDFNTRTRHMNLPCAFKQRLKKHHVDLDKIFPPARSTPAKTKIFCNSIPAIVGPWRGAVRAWHAPGVADRSENRKSDHASCGTTVYGPAVALEHAADLVVASKPTVPRLRQALRRERQLGLAGHPSYNVERHRDLHAALMAAAGASTKAPMPSKSIKTEAAGNVRGRRGQCARGQCAVQRTLH